MRRTILAVLVLASTPLAQYRHVPTRAATHDGTAFSLYPFQPFNRAYHFRSQHLIEGAAFCNTSAVIRAFSYRWSGVWSPSAPQVVTGLTLTIGHSQATPRTMSLTWAANRSGPQTVVINNGTYNLPGWTWTGRAGPWGVVAFPISRPFLYQRSNGNLLLEFDIAGVPIRYYNYALDADIAGGLAIHQGGLAGRFANGQRAPISVNFQTRMHYGGQVEVTSSILKIPGLAFYGFSRTAWGPVRLPLDLTRWGAPGNTLYASPDIALVMQQRFWFFSAILPIPNVPSLAGLSLFLQATYPDPAANALGWVFTSLMEARIGAPSSPMMQIFGLRNSPKAYGGFMGGGPAPGTPGGPTVRLTGAFN